MPTCRSSSCSTRSTRSTRPAGRRKRGNATATIEPAELGAAPLVSVVIPAYDAEGFLGEAVASIRAQGYAPLEIVIVDDGSHDGTARVAAALGEGVRLLRQENRGPAAARNAGLAAASGSVIAFLDADDLWTAGRLAPMVESLRSDASLELVIGHTRRVRSRDADGAATDPDGAETGTPPDAALFPYSIGAAVYRRAVFDRVGGFDPTLRFGEDQDWFLRARERGVSMRVLPDVVEVKRKHDRNMTRGKTLVERNLPTILKRAIDRRRGADAPLRFFATAVDAWQRAATAAGTIERRYAIGGAVVTVRFAGPALVSFLDPALAHLAIADDSVVSPSGSPQGATPTLTVHAWDSASTGVPMPPPPWKAEDYLPRGEIRGYNDARVRTVYNLGDHVLRTIDLGTNAAVLWTADPATLPTWERGAPLRTILHWWMSPRGRQLVHAASVGIDGRGVLIAGRGGSGKSTTALACLEAGFVYAGDDYVLLDATDAPAAASLYNTAKLTPAQLERFPGLAALRVDRDRARGDKALLFLHPARAAQLRRQLPLAAILLPRITGARDTRVRPAPAGASLAALAPTTVFQLPGDAERTLEAVAAAARRLPSHWLELGTDLEQIPHAIAAIVAATP